VGFEPTPLFAAQRPPGPKTFLSALFQMTTVRVRVS
jgi:hypothetical protein